MCYESKWVCLDQVNGKLPLQLNSAENIRRAFPQQDGRKVNRQQARFPEDRPGTKIANRNILNVSSLLLIPAVLHITEAHATKPSSVPLDDSSRHP